MFTYSNRPLTTDEMIVVEDSLIDCCRKLMLTLFILDVYDSTCDECGGIHLGDLTDLEQFITEHIQSIHNSKLRKIYEEEH